MATRVDETCSRLIMFIIKYKILLLNIYMHFIGFVTMTMPCEEQFKNHSNHMTGNSKPCRVVVSLFSKIITHHQPFFTPFITDYITNI